MNWFYALHGQQAGPVSEADLDELLRSGKINGETRVWREGMSDWQPLRLARPALGVPPAIPSRQGGVKCAECGRDFPADEVIRLNNSWVCAACKPTFVQRLREGAVPSGLAGGYWRTNNQLVTSSETPLPDRCVRCNAPANGFRLKRKFNWHPPAYFLLLFLNLLIYAIVAMSVRKTATLHIGLCETHRARRKQGIIVGWTGALAGIGLIIGAVSAGSGIMGLAGAALLLGAMIYGAVTGAGVNPAKITKDYIWLKGVNREYLADLPEWTGP